MHKEHRRFSRLVLIVVASGVFLAPQAFAATTGSGSVAADVGQLVEITTSDSTIASYSEFTPVSGAEAVKSSTTDYLRFSSAKSNIQTLWSYGVGVSFVKDTDGSTATTTVSYQGATTTLTDLVYLAQSSSGSFLPWAVATGTDLTSEGNTGWTNAAGCGTMVYEGSFSIPYYNNAGAAQTALTKYYRVCDSSTELYIADTRDLSAADSAIIYTQASVGSSATAGNYEVAISGLDYVFYSAASATTVTLRQGPHVPFGTSAQTNDVYALMKFPDGFPAGAFTSTVTATTTDIVS